MHDGADVLSFPAKPERPRQQSETDAVAKELDRVLTKAHADQYRADVVSIALRQVLAGASTQIGDLGVAMLAIERKHVGAFNSELQSIYNHCFSLMNRIRASYGEPAFVAPGIPFDPLKDACAHPGVCTCRECQARDAKGCGNE